MFVVLLTPSFLCTQFTGHSLMYLTSCLLEEWLQSNMTLQVALRDIISVHGGDGLAVGLNDLSVLFQP